MIYINRHKRKIFSYEAVADHPVEWLKGKIQEASDPDEWQFYFNQSPSEEVRHDLLREVTPNEG